MPLMKFSLILLLLCVCKISNANRIDRLKSEADVEKLIISVDSGIRENLGRWAIKVMSKQQLVNAVKPLSATQLQGQGAWNKADLNDDGQTDLIVYTTVYGVLIVMDTGKGNFKVVRIKSFPSTPIVYAAKIGRRTVLLVKHLDCYDKSGLEKTLVRLKPDTLIYRYGQFVELNHQPAKYDIATVTIFTGLCAFGHCPSYKLVVNGNGQARYVAGGFLPKQGVFAGQLTPDKTNKIISLLNYIKVKELQDRYQPNCVMDGGGWQLVVTFKDDSQKKIYDFNGGGTFGLEAIYAMMDNIAQTQPWNLIK
jgi:hypothetical protein